MSVCVNVIGAGLAGCEAAWAVAGAGINVRLYDAYFKVNYIRNGCKCTQYIECKKIKQEDIERICTLKGNEKDEWLRGKIPQGLSVIGTILLECQKED